MMDIDDMIEILAIDLLGVVPEDERIVKGMINKEPVTLNIESRIGKAFVNIARRIEGEEVEIMCLEKNKITDKLNKMFNISS
jgi:septum site-determining protein MinD